MVSQYLRKSNLEKVVGSKQRVGSKRTSPLIGPQKGINKGNIDFPYDFFAEKPSGSVKQVFGFSRGSWRD